MEHLPYEKLLNEYYKTFTINIPLIISSLRELNKRACSIYRGGQLINYTFSLSGGCSLDEIKSFEKNIGYSLPEDYKQFLFYTNGLGLSEYVGSWFLNINSICEIKKIFGDFYPQKTLVIAQFNDGDIHAIIDLKSDSNFISRSQGKSGILK